MNAINILFDLDGTLTDPGVGITNSVARALEHYGIREDDRTKLYKFVGPPLKDSFMEYYGFSEQQAVEAITHYRAYFSVQGLFENEVYAGIAEMLKELKKSGKNLIVATSKPDVFSIRILEHFDLMKYFSFVAGATMDEKRTRKDEVIHYALEQCGITDLSDAIMVGDRKHDILGAKANGLASVGVLYGYGDREELTDAGADFLAETPEDLKQLLL